MDHPPEPYLPHLVFRHSPGPETHQPPDLRLHHLLRPDPRSQRPCLPSRRRRQGKSPPSPPRRNHQNLRHPSRPRGAAKKVKQVGSLADQQVLRENPRYARLPIFPNLDHQRIVEIDFLFYSDGGAYSNVQPFQILEEFGVAVFYPDHFVGFSNGGFFEQEPADRYHFSIG